MIPLSSVPIEVRKEYALSLLALDVLEPEEALVVTIAPGDVLVPDLDWTEPPTFAATHWRATCEDCGKTCWTRGGTPRCQACFNRVLNHDRRKRGYCSAGHPWTEENVYTRPNGDRYCRVCAREDKRRYRERKRAAA